MNLSNLMFNTTSSLKDKVVLSDNITTLKGETKCVLKTEDLSLITSYSIVFCVGVFGNSLVLFGFGSYGRKRPMLDLLILYLAFFDLLASIFGPFVFVYWIITCNKSWHFGWFGCKTLPPLCRIFTDISIGIILIMAIDRSRAIVTPLKQSIRRTTIHTAVMATVVLSVLCETYYINALYIDNTTGRCVLPEIMRTPTYSYPLIVLTMGRNIAFVIIFAITTLAVRAKLYNSNHLKLLRSNSKRRNQRSAQVMKMLIVMAVVFAISVIPRDLLHLSYTISWVVPGNNGIILS